MRTLLTTIAVLVLCRVAVAGTIQQRLTSDPDFQLYVAIFKVTRAADGAVTDVQSTPSVDVRAQNAHPNADPKPVNIKIPRAYIAVAAKKIRRKFKVAARRSGKPEQFYTYFYYSPQLGERVVEDVHERE
jgi:hypothetical protein